MTVAPRPVVPGVHLLEFVPGQAYLWDWGAGLTVVDTGSPGSAGAILDAVAAIGRRPADVKEILLTHFHDDHRGGAAELAARTGAPVLAHPADAPAIRGDRPGPPPVPTEAERALAAQVGPGVPPAAPVGVDREVEDGETTAGGGRIVGVPGHTPGSIALLVPRLGVLFTGDALAAFEGDAILGVFNVDRAAAIASVHTLAGLEFDAACFGHGAPLVGGAGGRIRALAERLRLASP
jgi:glyoxylase-like metal-dependent hydrolase (beta-lactamase superfamily II)